MNDRTAAWIYALILGSTGILYLWRPPLFAYVIAANAISLAFYWWRRGFFRRSWLNVLAFTYLQFFVLSAQFYLAFSASRPVALVWLVLVVYLYYRLLSETGRWLTLALIPPAVNWYAYGGFFSVFFSASAVYGLRTYLGLPLGLLVLAALANFLAAFALSLRAGGRFEVRGAVATLVSTLLIAEIAWSISFLPFRYYVNGFILAVNFYLLLGLSGRQVIDKLTPREVRLYILLAAAFLILVLATARWF